MPAPYLLSADDDFPDPEKSLTEPSGLLAIGGDLSPKRLLAAYRNGIFPWFTEDQPILWWSPDPRAILFLDELRISHSLAKKLRQQIYTVTFDKAFSEVIQACAQPRKNISGTWITPTMINAYSELHRLGYVNSVEVWFEGLLVGGLYGISLGKIFCGESMFSKKTDASKIALVFLVKKLQAENYQFIDCQVLNAHLASLGAREIPRKDFLAAVRGCLD